LDYICGEILGVPLANRFAYCYCLCSLLLGGRTYMYTLAPPESE